MKLRSILPNVLTVLRLALTPVIAAAILGEKYTAALGICALAGLSDGVDGAVARRLGGETRFGAYLDPIADKLFVSVLYICLAWRGAVPWWLVILVFARDAAILAAAGALMVAKGLKDFRPSVWGKVATSTHVATIIAVLVNRAWPSDSKETIVAGLIGLAGLATLWSGADYAWRAVRMVRLRQAPSRP